MEIFRRLRPQALMAICAKAAVAWAADNASSMGAALAYYTLFSVAPILIIAMAIAGSVFGPQVAETHVLSQLSSLIGPTGAAAVRDMILSAHYSDKKGFAAAAAIVTVIIGATSVFGELEYALGRIWKTPVIAQKRGWWGLIRGRVFSLGMVVGVGFLLLVSLIASAALSAFSAWLGVLLSPLHYLLGMLDFVVSFGMTIVLFALIFKYAPRERVAWQDVWVGGTVTAFLFTVGKSLIGLYIGTSSFSSAYGAAGSLVVLLVWIYYSAQIFLFGAEFTREFAYALGSRTASTRDDAA
jgi:membrane protein